MQQSIAGIVRKQNGKGDESQSVGLLNTLRVRHQARRIPVQQSIAGIVRKQNGKGDESQSVGS